MPKFSYAVIALFAVIALLGATNVAQAQEPAGADNTLAGEFDNKIQWETPDGQHEFRVGGRLHFTMEFNYVTRRVGNDAVGTNGWEVRRARLYIRGKHFKNEDVSVGYKLQFDFTDGEAVLKDTYMDLMFGFGTVRVGQFKFNRSVENLTSSNDLATRERSIGLGLLGPERAVGVGWMNHDLMDKMLGIEFLLMLITNDDGDSQAVADEQFSAILRAYFAPIMDDEMILQAGLIFAFVLLEDFGGYQSRSRGNKHLGDRIFDSGGVAGDYSLHFSLHALAIMGPLHVVAEWYVVGIHDSIGAGNGEDLTTTWHAAYLQVGFTLTGEMRGWKAGALKGIKPANPMGQGGIGAIEAILRFEYLDMVDDYVGFAPTRSGVGLTIGINWWMWAFARMIVDFSWYGQELGGDGYFFGIRFDFHI